MARHWRLPLMIAIALALVIALISVLGRPAAAQGREEGQRLAVQWCAGCHDVAGSTTSDMAPGFRQVANDPEISPERLRAWLSSPHPVMPDFGLSRLEIESLVAYLESLADR